MGTTNEIAQIFKELQYAGKVKTQTDFGEKLGYKPSFTSRLLAGKEKEPNDLRKKLSETFGYTKKPESKESGEEAKEHTEAHDQVIPDPQMPGIYQDIVRQLIRSSEAQIRISEALLEERQMIRETAQAAIDLAHKVQDTPDLSSLNTLEHRTDVIERSLLDVQRAVIYGFAEVLHKPPADIETQLHTGDWAAERTIVSTGKKTIKGN